MRIMLVWILAPLALLTGCVALSSQLEGDGLVYHLPKSILTVTVREMTDTTVGHTWYELGGSALNEKGELLKEQHLIPEETVPDPRHRYVINYRPSAFSDDRLCISRSPKGLLYDVQFAADDRTPQIAFNISRFIAGAIGPEKRAGYSFQKKVDGTDVVMRQFVSKVDPFDVEDVEAYNAALSNYFRQPVYVSFDRMRQMIAPSAQTWPPGCSLKKGCPQKAWSKRCAPGFICYRTKLTLPVELKHQARTVDINYADVVNSWDIGTISVERAFLVQKITKLRFDRGALVAAIVRKPSEVEEVSLLPINVLNAALSTPSGLWVAAFSGNNKFKEDTIKELSTLSQQVATINQNVNNLQIGVTGATPVDATQQYQLNCEGETRSGFTNIIGDTWISKQ